MPATVSNGTSTIGIPSLVPLQRGVRLTICGVSPSVFSFASWLIGRFRDVALPRKLGERVLLLQPRVIFLLFLYDDLASHLRMRDTAEFRAENLECSGAGGREPVIRDRARYHIHLRPELGHIEIMQDIN